MPNLTEKAARAQSDLLRTAMIQIVNDPERALHFALGAIHDCQLIEAADKPEKDEAVARAMAANSFHSNYPWEKIGSAIQDSYRSAARAAIQVVNQWPTSSSTPEQIDDKFTQS